MKRLLAINGSYRQDGAIDQAIAAAVQAAEAGGAQVETVNLRDYPIEFCRNCRACTQEHGDKPGRCVQDDGMQALIDRIEAADGYILASPTNFLSVTALFKRFIERLVVYAYWPWGMPAPRYRKAAPTKPAILIATCAAPGIMGRLLYGTLKQLRATARTLGAKPVGTAFIGLVSQQEQPQLDERSRRRLRRQVARLL